MDLDDYLMGLLLLANELVRPRNTITHANTGLV